MAGPLSELIDNPRLAADYVRLELSGVSSTYVGIAISLQTVDLEQVWPLARLASSVRVRRAESTLSSLRHLYIPPFDSSYIYDPEVGAYRLSLAPIAELHEGRLVLIDGLHRAIAARRAGLTSMRVLVISGVLPPLAAAPISWDTVRIVETQRLERFSQLVPSYLCRRLKFRGYRRSHFRPIGSFLGSDYFCFDSIQAMRAHVLHVVAAPPFVASRSASSPPTDPQISPHYRLSA